MDAVGIGDFGGADDGRDIQIGIHGRCRTDAHGFVGKAHVHEVAVGLGVDGYGTNPQFLAGTQDTQGNFTAVGNDNLFQHDGSP